MGQTFQSNLVYVYGPYASGKTVLMRLLDGHPQVGVIPIHDTFPRAIKSLSDARDISNNMDKERISIRKLKKEIAKNSNYYQLQSLHHGGPLSITASSKNVHKQGIGEFDFYSFEERWISKVESGNQDVENILIEIIKAFFEEWSEYPCDGPKCNTYVGLGYWWGTEEIRYILESYRNTKVIFLKRDPRGCVTSKYAKSKTGGSAYNAMIKGEIYEIQRMYKNIEEMSVKYKDRIESIEFEDIVLDTEDTISEICEFLNISKNDTVKEPTYCGKRLDQYEEKFLGSINDNWQDIASDREETLGNLQMDDESIFNVKASFILDVLTSYTMAHTRKTLKELYKYYKKKLKK